MSKGILLDFNLQLTRISRSCSESTRWESIINCFGSYGNSGGGKPMLKEIKNIIRKHGSSKLVTGWQQVTAKTAKTAAGGSEARFHVFFKFFFHLAAFCSPGYTPLEELLQFLCFQKTIECWRVAFSTWDLQMSIPTFFNRIIKEVTDGVKVQR